MIEFSKARTSRFYFESWDLFGVGLSFSKASLYPPKL